MKGGTLLATLSRLGIATSYSRPRTSNDNPYSEALFRTCNFHPVTELTDQYLKRATELDFDHEVALVVTTKRGEEEILIGVGRYAVGEETEAGRYAELAFTVEEDYQGLGIASRLLRHLIPIGRQRNVSRFLADVLEGNHAMLRVFAGSGLPMKQQPDGQVVHVTLFLDKTLP